jgi:Fe2+ transport system protein FeoA
MKPFALTTRWHDSAPWDATIHCPQPLTCPLSGVEAGRAVRIKALSAPPEVTRRLREIGLVEQQVIRLLFRQSNLICLVCNARLALSTHLAQMIIVEPLAA